MAKAQIKTANGTIVTVEGTPVEVASLVSQLSGAASAKEKKAKNYKLEPSGKNPPKPTPVTLIAELIDGGFFKKPKGLGAIKNALEEHGHFYPVTTLSSTMIRFVRKRQIRRIKDNKRWLYVE